MKIRHEHSGYFGPPPLHCPCCGTKESQSGCVRGFTCQCDWKWCKKCFKCSKHCQCEKHLDALDREAVEGFAFFLSVAGKPDEQDAPYRHLARYWYEGLLTPAEGKRIREEDKRTKIESPGEA